MAAVIDQTLFPVDTPIPPGEAIKSAYINVSGARHITVNVILGGGSENIQRGIVFVSGGQKAPDGETLFVEMVLPEDSFGSDGQLWTLVPVHGPRFKVALKNNGSQPAKVFGAWVYAVRQAP